MRPGPLDTITRRAGGVLVARGDTSVAEHFGSPAGELAVCIRAAGLADRSDLAKVLLSGSHAAVAELVQRATGSALRPGGVLVSGTTWWCTAAPDSVLVVGEPAASRRLIGMLRAQARHLPGVRIADRSDALAAIALIGRFSGRVLAALGALGPAGDPRSAAPFSRVAIAGVDVQLLLQSDQRALLLCDATAAPALWRALLDAGRPAGLSCVGTSALERFALIDRAPARRA